MIKTRLLCGAAAIFTLGVGTASAQQPAPQPAPAEKIAPSTKAEIKGGGVTDANANAVKPAPSTTGQGAAGAHGSLTTEQRGKIATVIKQQKVAPARLNVTVKVGTRIPASVQYHPLPAEVVTIYPEWRGYDYILVGDQIVVIDPGTREIVAVLEA